MRRVLVIAFEFPPEGGTAVIRAAKFAKYLPQFGWQPVVLCSDVAIKPDLALERELPEAVLIYRLPWRGPLGRYRPASARRSGAAVGLPARASGPGRVMSALARRLMVPDEFLPWAHAAQALCADILHEHPCDAVLSIAPPNSLHLVGRWVHAKYNLPWLADFRDAWTVGNPVLKRLGRLNFARQRAAERAALEACDAGTVVTEPLRQQTIATFGQALDQKLTTITNGFDPDDFAGPQPPLAEDFVIAYPGTMVGPWMDHAFPEGLRMALAQDDAFRKAARVHFMGRLGPEMQSRLAGLEDNVWISGFVPHAEAIAFMRRSHVLLLTLPDSDLSRMTYTNKFFEYLASRRPILAVVPDGLISAIVIQEKVGLVASPSDPSAIAQALLTMFEVVRQRPDGYCASDALLASFDRRELTRNLAGVLNAISTGRAIEQELSA